MNKPAIGSSNQTILRGWQREDMAAYRRWLADPKVTAFLEMGWRPISDVQSEADYRSMTEGSDNIVFAIVDADGGQTIGTCGLYQIQWPARRAQMNILIGEPSAWNKGKGTNALENLCAYGFLTANLELIFLGVNAENKGAIRSYEKAGFVHEGRRRSFVYRNGKYFDSIMMSLLRAEWMARRV